MHIYRFAGLPLIGNKESVISLFPTQAYCIFTFTTNIQLLIVTIKYLLCCTFITLGVFQHCAVRQDHDHCQ